MAPQNKAIELDYTPQPRQLLLHQTPARLILYGGAVGGGKSAGLRWDLIRWCLKVPGIQCTLFRRTLPELEKNHIRQIRAELAPELGQYNQTKAVYEFFNGSAINFGYAERESDVERQQGQEIHVLAVDEAGQLTEYQLTYLIGRNRLGGFREKVPENFRPFLPRAIFASNPGGPAHSWLKANFISMAPAGELFHNPLFRDPRDPEDKGRLSIFIPAKMVDNAYIDSDYAASLNALPPELARAYRDGDWDAVVGQALPISRGRHMLRPFTPPRHWTRFMSMDWGTGKPFSVGWYCVSDGDAILNSRDGYHERYLPAGAVIRYAELYGWNGKSDQGSRKDSRTVAREIRALEEARKEPPMDYRIGDSSMWSVHDGPSPAENMADETGISLRPSQKDRERNYDEILARLAGNPLIRSNGVTEEHPMFFCTADCTHFWRTVPILTLDETDPNKGPDSKLEDHVYDELAYALRSRPFVMTREARREIEYQERRRRAGLGGGSRYATA